MLFSLFLSLDRSRRGYIVYRSCSNSRTTISICKYTVGIHTLKHPRIPGGFMEHLAYPVYRLYRANNASLFESIQREGVVLHYTGSIDAIVTYTVHSVPFRSIIFCDRGCMHRQRHPRNAVQYTPQAVCVLPRRNNME